MKTAVLIPCRNEARTVGKVIDDFRRELPSAEIYVYDNNSTDVTAAVAGEHGAEVRAAPRPGKGMVIRQMFAEVDADIYVLVDGDDTYRAEDVHRLLEPVQSGSCDMSVANRLVEYAPGSFPPLHGFGNRLISWLTAKFYGKKIDDMLSGFRVMTREMIDELCLISAGFEIETEINIKSIRHGFQICCLPSYYSHRPEGSQSKIHTLGDGYRILATLFMLFQEYQPVTMGGIAFLLLNLIGLALVLGGWLGSNPFLFFTGLFLSAAGLLILCTGVILHAVNMAAREGEEHRRRLARRGEPGE